MKPTVPFFWFRYEKCLEAEINNTCSANSSKVLSKKGWTTTVTTTTIRNQKKMSAAAATVSATTPDDEKKNKRNNRRKKNWRKTFKWQICHYCLNSNGHKWWGTAKSGRACDIQKHDVHQVIIFFGSQM